MMSKTVHKKYFLSAFTDYLFTISIHFLLILFTVLFFTLLSSYLYRGNLRANV